MKRCWLWWPEERKPPCSRYFGAMQELFWAWPDAWAWTRPVERTWCRKFLAKFWKNARDFNPQRASARAWLLAIAHHTTVDHLRRMEARPQAIEPGEDEPETFDLPGPGINEEHHLDRIRLRQALARLGPEEREVIEVLFFQGYAHQEAALKLNISPRYSQNPGPPSAFPPEGGAT